MRHRVGIVGAGQLARMMAQAAIPLGIEITLLAASEEDGASRVVPRRIIGEPNDAERLHELADMVDVVTFDHELVDPNLLDTLEAEGHTVFPGTSTMRLAQNKLRQRELFTAEGIPGPAWSALSTSSDVQQFGDEYGWPVVLKAVTGGYDGRGVWIVDDLEQATVVLEDAHGRGVDLIAEQHLQLTGEIAVLVARTADGDCRVFPATETVQRGGICHLLRVPAGFGVAIAARAEELALRIADIVESVGILAVEFFVIGADVLVNELAPRPHNSGHWTIEGTVVSQFEQHLRAVLGWPLGSTAMTAKAVVTRNLLGPDDGSDPFTVLPDALATGRASIHWYGKSSRPGRKLGHVTAAADSVPEAEAIASNAWSILSRAPRVGT